jgi:dipicolinate synthase subunit A
MLDSVAIIGGDRRQKYLSELFLRGGTVVYTALNDLCGGGDLAAALAAGNIILPVPLSRDGVHLNAACTAQQLELDCLFSMLPRGKRLFGLPADKASELGCSGYDYAARSDFALANALPTAEGAISMAVNASDGVICHSRCMIVGYGRIGKLLAVRLDGLGAFVTIACRSATDRAVAGSYGFNVIDSSALDKYDFDYDYVFNTVPVRLLEPVADRMAGSVLIELASAPYGMSSAAAEEAGIKLCLGTGLPGKTAPKYAAEVIYATIHSIIAEECL